MQKTEHSTRLRHLATKRGVFCILTALLAVAAFAVCAGEPVTTLVKADARDASASSNAPAATGTRFGPDGSLSTLTNNASATLLPEDQMTAEFAAAIPLEKSDITGPSDSLQLLRENRTAASRSNVSFSVQAGYGRIWDEHSMLSKISAGHQETGCAYVGAKISF